MKLYANLHTHSTHSDGKYSPAEMVKVAKDEGYKALAITDHDTATAFPFLKEECEGSLTWNIPENFGKGFIKVTVKETEENLEEE